jgi:hypothetical protein
MTFKGCCIGYLMLITLLRGKWNGYLTDEFAEAKRVSVCPLIAHLSSWSLVAWG